MLSPINTSTNQYYYFNWNVCDPLCESERSEVKIISDDCEGIRDLSEITLFPNPNQGNSPLGFLRIQKVIL